MRFLPPRSHLSNSHRITDAYDTATGEPDGHLWRADENDYSPDSANSARTNAALITLVRNEELNDLLKTMHDLERTWNSKFNYPYIFFNDVPFSEEFKQKTQAATKAAVQYGSSPPPKSHLSVFRKSEAI